MSLPLVSASQITGFRECARKWAWKYIAKIEAPPHPSALLGTDVHAQLEGYLGQGKPLDFSKDTGYIAAPALEMLPKPMSEGLEVEKHFEMPSHTPNAGFGYQGYIDVWLPTGGMPGVGSPSDVYPAVVDFKTTGNWNYAKTAENLKTDVQAQVYAMWAMREMKSTLVDLVWIYMATRGARKARRVHLRVHGQDVAQQFSAINDTAIQMLEIRKTVTDPLSLPPTPSMCEAYGGCPYRSQCNLSPGEIIDSQAAKWVNQMESTTVNTTSSLLAQLKAKRAGIKTGYEMSPEQLNGQAAADKGVAVVGINPPESLLPPAPPVGAAPIALVEPAVAIEKAKRGRPKKDPLGADAAAHTAPAVIITKDAYEDAIQKQIAKDEAKTPARCPPVGAFIRVKFTRGLYEVDVSYELSPGETLEDSLARLCTGAA